MGHERFMSTYVSRYRNKVQRACPVCKQDYLTIPAELARGGGLFCSMKCRGIAQRKPVEERFWKKVNKTDTCWLWTGAHNGKSEKRKWPYGLLSKDRSRNTHYRAHELSWELHNGPVPEGMWVLHKCDVTLCVNPDHLFLGTAADNTADMLQKGRAKGGRPKGTKLSPESLASFRSKRGYTQP